MISGLYRPRNSCVARVCDSPPSEYAQKAEHYDVFISMSVLALAYSCGRSSIRAETCDPVCRIMGVEMGRRVFAIPGRAVVVKELANLLGALAHPHRIRIVEELRTEEMDVNSLQQILGISHSSVSQNLSVLRSHRLVQERRDGRRVIYKLREPKLASWLVDGLLFVEGAQSVNEQIRSAVEIARTMWSTNSQSSTPSSGQEG